MENDLISRSALLERLAFKRMGSMERNTYPGLESAIAQVKKAPAVDVPKWISVEDKLPNGWVLIDPDTDYREPETYIVFVEGAMFPTTAYFIDGEFVSPCEVDCVRNCGFVNRITHWMPLPEPPKEV